MKGLPRPLQIVGYAGMLSAQAGDTVTFHVSSALTGAAAAAVHRLLGGGFDPRAPRLRTEQVADLGSIELQDQPVPLGSRANAFWREGLALDAGAFEVTVQRRLAGAEQTIAWLGGPEGLGLTIAESGALRVVQDSRAIAETVDALPLGMWTRVAVSWSGTEVSIAAGRDAGRSVSGRLAHPVGTISMLTLAARPTADGFDAHLSARLERPVLSSGDGSVVASWDFSRDIPEWTVPGEGSHAAELTLHQAPVRGVRGAGWTDGSDYRETPDQYGAIHFHADSLEDCEWESQAQWTVPTDARSGFYGLHVVSGDAEDWIPFFVRPAAGTARAELLVVASTATYFAYGNSRFWWEDPIQEIAQDRLVELGREEQYLVTHPELGLSNYDRHLDDAPVVFSSRRRPNLFMRPGHSRSESYASDLYLIAWLERTGIPYDVLTDEDVHFGGGRLLAPYRAIVGGSHPEYWSVDMYDGTKSWVEAGGRYLYLGGNGYTSCVAWRPDRPWLMENRATGNLQNDAETIAAESINQLDGRLGRRLDESGRSPGSLFGVDTVTMGFDRSYPVLRADASYEPELAWAFEGIASRLFGGRSLSGGGVIGQEWDNARNMAGTPGHYVLASSIDHSLIPTILGADEAHHGDIVAFFQGDGVVVSASAMAWVGALHIDDYDNDAERFVRNVVRRFLDAAPLTQPASNAERTQ